MKIVRSVEGAGERLRLTLESGDLVTHSKLTQDGETKEEVTLILDECVKNLLLLLREIQEPIP